MPLLKHKALKAVAPVAAAIGLCATGLGFTGMSEAANAQNPTDASDNTIGTKTSNWQANDDDFLFLQLVIENYKLTYDVRGYKTDRGVCLDLADVIQSLDMPIRVDKKSRRATGWLFAEDQKFTLDRDSDTVQNANTGRAPLGTDIFDTPEGWCVDVRAMSKWFGIDFKPDLYNAIVRIESEKDLPFMQAIERKSRAARLGTKRKSFDLSQMPSQEMEYRPWRMPSVDILARTGYRGGGGTSGEVSGKVELYASGEAFGASYTARLATDNQLTPQSLRFTAYRNDPAGELLGPLKATQAAIGDVETQPGQLTGQTMAGRGAFISNRPLGRVSRFSTTSLRGVLPAGWDAELYRNGQLIAFQQDDDGDGRYEFLDVELFFGRNELEVVLYGPQGQIRREKSDFPVGTSNVEPGKTHYWAGIVQDNHDLIQIDSENVSGPQSWRWGLGIERGLDERTSATFGVQSLVVAGRRRYYAEAAINRSLGSVYVDLATAYEWGAGAATEFNAQGRIAGINYGANVLWTFGDFASEFVAADLDQRLGLNFDASLRFGSLVLPVQAAINHEIMRDGSSSTEMLATTSVTAGRLAISAQLEHREQHAGSQIPSDSQTSLRLLANTRIKGVRLRGNATFDLGGQNSGLDTVQLVADAGLSEVSDITGEIEHSMRSDYTRFTVGYARRFDKFSLRADANVSTNGQVGANLSLNFSIGPDPARGGIRFSQNKLARTGQAAVTVFRDDNGDGRRNPGEALLKDVGVEAGFRPVDALTNDRGQTILDGLKPFTPVLVGVDEASLGDPYLAPRSKGIVIVPRPGVAAQIMLAISPSGEVEGVLYGLNGLEQAGVQLELVDMQGMVVASAMSEFDGFFLIERVPYGEYRLRVAQAAAKKLGVEPMLETILSVSRDQDIVRLGSTRLKLSQPQIVDQGGTLPPARIRGLNAGGR